MRDNQGSEVTLGADVLSALISGGIYNALDQESKDKLVRVAIENVLQYRNYGGRTEIQNIFARAAAKRAEEIADEVLSENKEFAEKVKAMVRRAVQDALAKQIEFKEMMEVAAARAIVSWTTGE